MGVVRTAVALSVASLVALTPASAVAQGAGECHVVGVSFKPEGRTDLSPGRNLPPQIVVWLEDPTGNYIETVFITRETGTYGLGNRPGRFDFNSGPMWPYGRRITVFPVWAERKKTADGLPMLFDEVVFQNGDDDNLSHPFNQSSRDTHYCRPMQPQEVHWDALTCASPNSVYTDKGQFSAQKNKYPPRKDITRAPGMDSIDVDLFAMGNPFDAVSHATPTVDQLAEINWPIPQGLAAGDYVMWVEVSKEFDHNATYSTTAYPAPTAIPWSEYGEAYRGQPSVLYQVPFTIGTVESSGQTSDYAGYGDPDGLDGNLRAPDATISTNVQGSGAARFALVPDGAGGMYRVRVTARPEFDDEVPANPAQMAATDTTSRSATITFIAPGDDGLIGKVSGYDVRYRVGDDVTAENFGDARSLIPSELPAIGEPGTLARFTLDRLLPETEYSVGVRAFDDCHNQSELVVVGFRTAERPIGEVDACFVATAAYGSALAVDVQMLRHMRDSVLRKSVLGELAVQTYYTFSPAVAGVVGESDLLRATAREALTPLMRWVRAYRF